MNFHTERAEHDTIVRIAARAQAMAKKLDHKIDKLELVMDLSATHANDIPLDFEKLLKFPDHDFIHDVFGIRRHIDRKTGKLQNCFLPRCARKE